MPPPEGTPEAAGSAVVGEPAGEPAPGTTGIAAAMASLPDSTPPGADPAGEQSPGFSPLSLDRTVIAIPLLAELKQEADTGTSKVHDVIIDVNLRYRGGRAKAKERVAELIKELIQSIGTTELVGAQGVSRSKSELSEQYVFASLEGKVIRELVRRDGSSGSSDADRAIYHIWPDFPVNALTIESVKTVKADAARIAYAALGEGIVWAVLDSGIQGDHPHFRRHENLKHESSLRHKDFTSLKDDDDDESERRALSDEFGHGSHVAGILAGEQDVEKDQQERAAVPPGSGTAAPAGAGAAAATRAGTEVVAASAARPASEAASSEAATTAARPAEGVPGATQAVGTAGATPAAGEASASGTPASTVTPLPGIRAFTRHRDEAGNIKFEPLKITRISGMAPKCKLLSLKVLNEGGRGKASNLIAAIEYVQRLNGYGRHLAVHGVNLSVGYEFEPEWFACGQSPLCVEVDRLVRTGVVVVVAAGNTGYGWIDAKGKGSASAGMDLTINDPGNAELAITVGSTHRDMPHVYGVSYFSSKGPTGDGRLKPDLVAPGEKILSCGAGRKLTEAVQSVGQTCDYIEDSGTSMAAPHVSGVIAAFLSIRREFIGKSERVKEIFLSTCTDLKRERSFQGHGLVDLIRAIQSV